MISNRNEFERGRKRLKSIQFKLGLKIGLSGPVVKSADS